MRKIVLLSALLTLLFSINMKAQVTVTGDGAGGSPYANLQAAIAALPATLTQNTVISVDAGNPQTAPAGGYSITTTGTASFSLTITGNGNTVTAPTPQTSGALNDAIFKIIGGDYITIQGFTMQENPANTTTAAGTNNMTEWGVALLYATTTNGAQNVTIQNNTITLNRTYQNTFGIYSNSTHAATTPTTSASATTAAGGNSNLKIYSNTINNVNHGIVVVGPTAVADANTGVEIGGASLGNTITNYGTTGTFSAYTNLATTPGVNGILIRNSNGFVVSNNTITSSVGGVTAGTLYGIHFPAASATPTATFTNNINSNNISLRSGLIAGAMTGINCPSGSASATSSININNNDFNNFGHTVAGTGAIIFIIQTSTHQTININNNTFTNITCNTTGSVTFISSSLSLPANGFQNINGNSIVTAFSKTGAGGTVTLFTNNGSSPVTVSEQNNNNNFSNITVTGATTIAGWSSTDGGSPVKTISGNTFSNWTGGTNAVTVLNTSFASSATVSNNTISNITGGGAITGISSASGTQTFTGNTITGLSTTGASTVSGISNSGGTTQVYSNNTICNLQADNASGAVNGILVSSGTTITLSNNRIADLRTPSANAANPLNGINITGGTTVNAYYNTVLLNGASTGALFGSSAISASTSPTVTLNNNVFINNSSVTGAGLAVAYRRSSTTLTTYGTTSNRNDFYASNIYTDGTTTNATIAAYQITVGPTRDANSVSENASFLSTTCGNASFLKINTAVSTLLESGGSAISGITDDFEGDTRNATTPDIGADEFAGTSPAPFVTFNSLTPGGNQCTATGHVVSVTVTTPSGTTITGVAITYNNGTLNSNVAMTNTSGNIWEYTIPAATPGNTSVSWSVTATNSVPLSYTFNGSSYADEPLTGVSLVVNPNPGTVCDGTPSVLTATISGNQTPPTGYCAAAFSSTTEDDIGQVTFAGINNPAVRPTPQFSNAAAANTYTDFTGIAAGVVNPGSTYPMTVYHFHGTTNTSANFCNVYIDFDRDGDFSDANEVFALSKPGATFNEDFVGNITIPSGVQLGKTRMRIILKEGAISTICGTAISTWGEVEDYLIDIQGAVSGVTWSDGTNTIGTTNPITVTPSATTDYTASSTYLGCPISSAPTPVTVIPLPTAPGAGSFPSAQCGSGVPNTAFVTGGTAGQYRWYTFDGSSYTLIPGETGASLTTYSISVTTTFYVAINDGTCESIKTAVVANVVAPDPVSASSNGPVCANSALTLTATVTNGTVGNTYSYEWTASPATGSGIPTSQPGGSGTFGSPASVNVTPTTGGTYIYTVNATDGPCITSATVTVTINAQPTIDSITAYPNPVCSGSPVSLGVYSAGGGFVNGPQTPPTGYCTATFSNTTEDDIGQVTFAGINNPAVRPTPQQNNAASVNTYTDYTATPAATVQKGASFPITVYHFHDGTDATANFCNVYIDFNRNGVFTDAGETFSLSKVAFLDDFTGTIAIPSDATAGITRMRVVLREGAITTPCGSIGTWGEAEDYLVNIQTVDPQNPTLTYSWSPVTGSTPSITDNPTVDPVVYTVTVSNANCSIAPTVTVNVLPLPDAPIGTNSQQCGTGIPSVSVATGGANGTGVFKWYLVPTGGTAIAGENGTTLTSYSISTPTSFYVSEVGTNGCESPRTQVDVTFDFIPDELELAASPSPICLGQSFTFSVTQTGGGNTFVFNYPSTLHAAGSGINIPNISGVDSSLLDAQITVTPTAAGTYTYTVRGFDPDKGCVSEDQTTVVVNPLPTITSFTVTPSPVCEGSVINLKAENIQSSSGSASIGSQTTTEFGGGVYRYGFGTGDFRHQLLYTASELTAAGFVAGNLTSMSFNVTSVGSGSSNNYTIKLAHTAATALTTTFQTATFTTCYVAPTYTAVSGTNLHTFTTPFAWDGTSNLLVEICYNVSTTGSSSTVGATTPAFTANTNLLGTAGACTAATGGTFANRPFAAFEGQVGVNLTGNYNWVFNPGTISGGTTGTATTLANTGITSYTATASSIATGCPKISDPVNITVNPLPTAPVSGGDVSRCGPGSVTLTATGSGGTLNWFNVASGGTSLGTGASFTTNVTGNTSFWVEETAASGCIGLRTQVNVTVTTAPTLVITPGGATTFCNGGSVVLDAGSASDPSYISFSWSPGGATTSSITANPGVTTTYTVTADDGLPNGCSNTAQITVTVNPNPTINPVTANPISICPGASSTLTATTNIIGAGTATIGTGTTLTGATSQPTAFNNRWPSYRMQLVYTAAELQAAGLTAGNLTSLAFDITTLGDEDFNDNFRIKIGNTALSTLTAFADTTSGFTDVYTPKTYTHAVGLNTIPFDAPFNWDGTSNIIVQVCMLGADNVNNSQTYYTATAGNTIAYTATAETNGASLSTNRLNIVFGGQVQTTGAGPYNWEWNPGALPGNVVTVTPASTQAYSVTATNPVTSCFTTVNNAVTVSVLPVASNATATPAAICLGQSSTLNSNGTGGLPLTYSWTVAGNPTVLGTAATLSVSPVANTIYEVTVTDACGNPTTSQVTVTVNSLPSVTVSPITASICQPGATPVLLTADGAITYTWAPATGLSATSGTSVDASPNVTTTYTVTGADANGCTDTAQAVIVVGATVQNLTASASLSTVCSGSPTVLTASAYVPRPVGSYTFSTAATGGTLDPMTGATEIIADSTDDTPMNLGFSTNTTAGNKIPIGFTFNINNTDYTYFGASPDGWVTFGNDNTAPSSDFSNGVTDATNIPKVYPYWDDLATGVGGSVRYLVTGSAPNRILIVEWFVTIPRATTGAANSRFQAWMYENGGKIEFRYGTMGSGTMSASVGVTGGTTQYQSVTVSGNTSSNSSANNGNTGQPGSGRIYSFVPTATFTWNPGNLTGASVTVNPTSNTVYTVTASSGFCTDTEDVTITVNPLTVVTVDASPTSQLVAQNSTATPLTVTATGTNVTYAWYSNTTNSSIGGTLVGAGSSYAPSTAATGILYYYAVATGDCGLDTSSVVSVETVDANTNFWTGTAGSNWHTAGSWSLNAVPTILNDAVIPTGATPYPILSANSTAKNLTIQSGATVSLNGQTLDIVQGVDPAGTGTFIGSATSNLSVGANSTLRFASGAGGVIKNLNINGGTTTLATALDVTAGTALNTNGVVTVANGAVLASGGNLTFKSNQFGTARLAQGATSGQWVTGNVTVERYIPANAQRAWRFLSAPTKGLQTIKQSWQENGTSSNTNPKPGYGTNLSTPLAAYGALGFDERTAKASIQFFNQATGAWVDVNSTLSGGNVPKIESVKGYSVYVRGDRTQYASGAVTSTTPTTLRTTGTLYTGNQAAIPVAANKFDLIGNTYVSAIDFLGLTRTNMVNTFYLWDPKLITGTPPNQSLGGYVTFSLTNGFVGVPNNSSYGITPRTTIQPGESFMVQANAGGGSIAFNESAKVAGDGINYYRPAAPTTGFEKMKANLFTVATDNTAVMADANVSVFDNLFSNAVDGDDAVKLINAGENFAIRRGATNLVVEGRQSITDYDTTFFWTWNLRQNVQYRLELIAENMNVTGRTAFLIDGYTNTTTQLDLAGGVTNYDFTINTDNLSFAAGRFKIVYRQVQPSPVPVSFVSVSAELSGAAINVNWKVAQETGIRQYVVERSSDGRNFAAGANVSATGNRGGDVSYSWLDATPLTGTNFYRIRSVGLNGEIKYSPIVKVLTGKTLPSFTVAPNPVEGSVVNLQFKNQEQGKYAIRLLAVTGEVIFTAVKEHAGGNSTQVLNLPAGLARGTYQLEIISPSKVREVQNLFINTLK